MNITGKFERITREDGKLRFHLLEVYHLVDNEAPATIQFQNLSICGERDGNYL